MKNRVGPFWQKAFVHARQIILAIDPVAVLARVRTPQGNRNSHEFRYRQKSLRNPFVFFFLALWLSHAPAVARAQAAKTEPGKSASLAGVMPSGAVGFAEVSGLGQHLKRLQGSSYLGEVLGSPQFQRLEKSTPYKKGDAARKIAETQLGMTLWSLFEGLLRDRLAVAVYPNEGSPAGNPAFNVVALLRGCSIPNFWRRSASVSSRFWRWPKSSSKPPTPFRGRKSFRSRARCSSPWAIPGSPRPARASCSPGPWD